MDWKRMVSLGVIGAGCLALVACSGQTDQNVKVDKITAETYVAPAGQTLDKLVYQLSGNSNAKLTADDFKVVITNTSVDYTTKEETVTEDEATIDDVSLEDDKLVIDITDIPYSTVTDIVVTGEDELYNSALADYTIATKTVDDFEKDTFTDSKGTEITYWLYTPKDKKNTPLVVWEHGGGEVLSSSYEGSHLVASQGATTWIENGYETSVLAVQYPENYSFGISEIEDELKQMEAYNTAKYELIQSLIKDGLVNENRVYVTGASSGGGGAVRFVMQYPDLFAGALIVSVKDTVVPISLKYDLAYQLDDESKLKITDEQYAETYDKMKEELAAYPDVVNVPIWFAQAENDQVTTSYTSIMMNDILTEMGAKNNKITLYSNDEMEKAGVHAVYHGSWQIVYQDKEMLDWLIDQEK